MMENRKDVCTVFSDYVLVIEYTGVRWIIGVPKRAGKGEGMHGIEV